MNRITTADVKSAWASKINWTQVVGGGAMVLAWTGVDMPPDVRAAIVTLIGAGTQVATWVLRTWFTKAVVA